MKKMFLVFSLILLAQVAKTQIKTLDRQYVPITLKTAQNPLFGLNVNEWTAFRFDRSSKSWTIMPFQFDQLTDTDRYDRNKDGVTDATDEITFLPTDAGDLAELWDWLADEATRQNERIELAITDPLDATKRGWIYLFKNVTTVQEAPSYLDYVAGPMGTPAADTIKTAAFKLGHNRNGWIDYLKFANGRQNIVDRFKLRLKGGGFLMPPYEINEDYVEASTGADAVSYFPGPVRSFHITKAEILLEKLGLPVIPKRSAFEYNYEYTPYSFEIEAETEIDAGLLAIFGVKLIRQSLDFNSHAAGMLFYSASNPEGILIDGLESTYSDILDQSQRQNWVMATSEHGTVFLIFDMDVMKNSRRRIYFHDQKENFQTGDGTANTGDPFSYGDMGVKIEATGDALITDRLTVRFKGYFVDKAQTNVAYGEQLLAWEQNPLLVAASAQNYQPAAVVEKDNPTPDQFQLHSAYPNPYSLASQTGVLFEFSGRPFESYDLYIYNVLGQQVATFTNLSVETNGKYQLCWNVQAENGSLPAPGIYLYQLKSGANIQTQKLVISR